MNRIRQGLRQIQGDIVSGKNLDAYMAIVLAVVFTVLDLLDVVNSDVLGGAILLTLTLLVIGSLQNRGLFDSIKRTVDSLYDKQGVVARFELPDEKRREMIRNSRSILFSGISLYRFIPNFHFDIEYALSKGATIRVMLVNPKNESLMDMVALRSPERLSKENERKRIQDTLDFLNGMKTRLPDGKIEVRTLDYMIPYGINIFEPISGNIKERWCFVRVHSFGTSVFESPVLKPDPINDNDLFAFFEKEYENMWKTAKTYPEPVKQTVPIDEESERNEKK